MKRITIIGWVTTIAIAFTPTAFAQTAADKEFMGKLIVLVLKGLTLTLKADVDGLTAQIPQFDQLLATQEISPDCIQAAQAKREATRATINFLQADEGSPEEVQSFDLMAQYGQLYDAKREACVKW